jgi:HAD superfamily hydrolase (TIGR01509 family)
MNTINFSKYKAFVFDLNGTLVNDMPYHIKAWHDELNRLGSNITMEEMKHQCYGKNDELLERVFPGRFTMEEKISIGNNKEAVYRVEFKPHLKLIEGAFEFITAAHQKNIPMAIGSAAILSNIEFVIQGTNIDHCFTAIVSADDVSISKPHPETFLSCAQQLQIDPSEILVFEDTPKGVECALNANMDAVVILGGHTLEEFQDYNNVVAAIQDYSSLI